MIKVETKKRSELKKNRLLVIARSIGDEAIQYLAKLYSFSGSPRTLRVLAMTVFGIIKKTGKFSALRRFYRGAAFLFLLLATLFAASAAYAACANPVGAAGDVVYNTDFKRLQYCNGTEWRVINSPGTGAAGTCANPAGDPGDVLYNGTQHVMQWCNGAQWRAMGPVPGAGGAGCANPAGTEGDVVYNTDYKVPQYCDGTNWYAMGVPIDINPATFAFTDLTNQPVSTLTVSDILQITSIDVPVTVSISGGGSPQFRICSNVTCSIEVFTWGSANQNITNGQYLQLRLTSSASYGVALAADVNVGSGSDNWSVTTVPPDTTPDAFTFTDLTNQPLSTLTTSNIIQITGITGPAAISATNGAEFRTCSDATCSSVIQTWTTSTTISNNQYLQVRITSSASDLTAVSTTVTVGTGSDNWSVTTGDTTPVAFNFTDLTAQPLSTVTNSNILQITGITLSTPVTISGAGQFRICTDATCSTAPAFGTTGNITNGQYLQLRITSSASELTAVNTTVTVGGGNDNWSVTTGDITPTAFAFTDLTNQTVSTLVSSNILQITGITMGATVSISGGGSPQFRICSNATCSAEVVTWGSANQTITNNQYLQLRLTSSGSFSTALNATVNVGSGSDNWSVTTEAIDTTPDAFSFTDLTNQTISTLLTSNIINITGINTSVSVSATGGAEFKINGGAWVTTGSITNGQTLQMRLTSSASFSTAVSTTVTVGGGSDNWSITTEAIDTTPDAFSFTDLTDQALSTLVTSNIINITGINTSVSVSISGGGAEFRVNGGAWVTSGSITNGQTLQLRMTTSGSYSTAVNTTVTVSAANDVWTATTAAPNDDTPDAFDFTDQTGVNPSILIYSNIVNITGINIPATVTISGTGSPQFSINGGAWGTSGSITNGQTLQLRLTSNTFSGSRSVTVNVGTGSDGWNVTTRAANGCTGTPWGNVGHGFSDYAYSNNNPGCGGSCAAVSNLLSCYDGSMTVGPYIYTGCDDSCAGCGPQGVSWSSCGGTTASVSHGQNSVVSNNVTGYTGSATYNCNDGNWSGPSSPSCNIVTCSLPWGGSINYNQSVTAWQTPSVSCGGTCSSQNRTCQSNGTLSGGYTNENCAPVCSGCSGGSVSWMTCSGTRQARSHGQSDVVSNTASGYTGSATYGCDDGSWTGPSPQSCAIKTCTSQAQSWGSCGGSTGTGSHGDTKVVTNSNSGYTGSASYTCNGDTNSWSGPTGSSCTPDVVTCTVPPSLGGGTINEGQSVTAWQNSSVNCGQSCVSQSRVCQSNGTLSGSYTNGSCSALPCPVCGAQQSTCAVGSVTGINSYNMECTPPAVSPNCSVGTWNCTSGGSTIPCECTTYMESDLECEGVCPFTCAF